MHVQEVFTPSSYPEHTYVEQEDKNLEVNLRRALNTPGAIVSLAGPSKSGKTVLVESVVDEDYLIVVQGSGIESPADLWEEVLDFMGAPTSVDTSAETDTEVGGKARTGGIFGIPGLFGGKGEVEAHGKRSKTSGETETYDRSGLKQLVEELANEDYVILIDDFHYLERSVQSEIAEVIKEAARQEISVCVALVPHRSDDIVRGNPDLRGRVRSLDVGYWDTQDLMKNCSHRV